MKSWLCFFTLLLLSFESSADTKKHRHNVAICAIFQNEADYLKEWIEYHRLIGVERFYLYNHNSTDHYRAVLKPYIETGIVKLSHVKKKAHRLTEWNRIQCRTYIDCIREIAEKVNWLALIDIDEFIVLSEPITLGHFLSRYPNAGAICVHWQMFGTSGIKQIPENRLLIETLTLKALPENPDNEHVKSIVRPNRVEEMKNPHYVKCLAPWYAVNPQHQPVIGAKNLLADTHLIQINHYWSRDENYFATRKAPKREKWGDKIESQKLRLSGYDATEDRKILRYVPELRKRMGL